MPSLENFVAGPVKALLLGNPGSGKTGALASLAKAGYNLRIADFDNGLGILRNLAKADPEVGKRIRYLTFTDKMTGGGGRPQAAQPSAWADFMRALDNWKDGEEKLGPISKWTDQDILVWDTLNISGRRALDYVLFKNARLGQAPWQSDWGEAMAMQEAALEYIYSDSVKCNVIVNTHLTPITTLQPSTGVEQTLMYPAALGSKLPPKISRYFDYVFMCVAETTGSLTRRKISTAPLGIVDLKAGDPTLQKTYPQETGLATIFQHLKGSK